MIWWYYCCEWISFRKLRLRSSVWRIYYCMLYMKLLALHIYLIYINIIYISQCNLVQMYVYIFSLHKLGSFIIVWIYFDRRIGFIWKCISSSCRNSSSSSSGHLKSVLYCMLCRGFCSSKTLVCNLHRSPILHYLTT